MRPKISSAELHLAVARLPELERRIICEFYGFGGGSATSDRLIGEGLAMQAQRVQYIRQRALEMLRSTLDVEDANVRR